MTNPHDMKMFAVERNGRLREGPRLDDRAHFTCDKISRLQKIKESEFWRICFFNENSSPYTTVTCELYSGLTEHYI